MTTLAELLERDEVFAQFWQKTHESTADGDHTAVVESIIQAFEFHFPITPVDEQFKPLAPEVVVAISQLVKIIQSIAPGNFKPLFDFPKKDTEDKIATVRICFVREGHWLPVRWRFDVTGETPTSSVTRDSVIRAIEDGLIRHLHKKIPNINLHLE